MTPWLEAKEMTMFGEGDDVMHGGAGTTMRRSWK